jgi:flavin reductase (DIM6/NTAB) family NADH-FMN oxidoreductase RutF
MNVLDARRFRDTIGLFATGVAVIVARAGEEVLALTVNAVSSLSLDPMLVLFCPGKKTRFAQYVQSVTAFSINFLRHDQQALSNYFAGSWREPVPPTFRFVPSSCAPRLEGSLAAIECEPERVVDAGDHWVVIGRVRAVHSGVRPHRPLVFFSGRYRNLDPAESVPAPDLANIRDEPAHIFYDRWSH